MAAGFKQATVNASDVPATQTNFPVYVDIDRMGVTTQAEADSIRVYSDSGKTTELAREIVSDAEMWVKVPSLTSSFTIYVDWDGTSSDYAVTDTYGRNNVWSNYMIVSHDAGTTNSTGGASGTANGGVTVGGATGHIGSATDFDGSNDTISFADASYSADESTSNMSFSAWVQADTIPGTTTGIFSRFNAGTDYIWFLGAKSSNSTASATVVTSGGNTNCEYVTGDTLETDGSWNFVALNFDGTGTLYIDAGLVVTGSTINGTTSNVNSDIYIGDIPRYTNAEFDGAISEVRHTNTALDGNWITTEWNNQQGESTFWGTWSDVSAGGAANNAIFAFGGM